MLSAIRPTRSLALRVTSFADEKSTAKAAATRVKFSVKQRVKFGEKVAIVGSEAQLGGWNAKKAVALQWQDNDTWVGEVEVPCGEEIEMKCVVVKQDNETVTWQPGNNIAFQVPTNAKLVLVEIPSFYDTSTAAIAVQPASSIVKDLTKETTATATNEESANIKSIEATAATATTNAASSSDACSSAGVVALIQSAQPLEKLTVPKLKALAKVADLPVSGKKAEIIERLNGHVADCM